MPRIHSLTLYCPSLSQLEQSKAKSIKGPKVFVDIIAKAENHQAIQAGIKALIKNDAYQSPSKGHFWYRIKNLQGSFEGVLTGVLTTTEAQDITTHEAVLEQRVELFSDYLNDVGFQAEPVLLMHENNDAAAALGKQVKARKADFNYHLDTELHQLWVLNKQEAFSLSHFCKQEQQFHLADGHHRYASTLNTGRINGNTPLLFSFLVAKDQVQNHAFTWAIKDQQLADQLLQNISSESICDKAAATIEIKIKDNHIYSKATKALTECNYIVEKLLGISAQQKIDLKSFIDYYPSGTLGHKNAKAYPAIVNYKPLSLDKIIALAKAQKILPPKSTYILPKLPTGLCFTSLDEGQIK
ncbi:MAG: DUF1015 family protein [Flavobacteriaceae bacterium]|jgi:uncharacterized protein (DUF1015 family)|nr:DUF1015 family protein [Flavobacteriaceae bacterium]